MNSTVVTQIQEFILSKQFWFWHGFVLSGLWVLISAIAILGKRLNIKIHVLLFICTNITTLFFVGSALYRVSSSLANFMQWSLMKKCHVIGGTIFLLLVVVEHLGGASAFFGNKENPQHRNFGKVLVVLGRGIACVGWVLGGNIQFAIAIGIISLVITVVSLVIPPSQKPGVGADVGEKGKLKSPRAKRQ